MQVLYAGMAVAAAIGALTGGAMQIDYYLGDRPNGPQQIYSMPVEYGHEAYAYSTIEFPSGPFADFVVGTDWLPGGRHDRAMQQAAYTPEPGPEAFEPLQLSLYEDYEMATPTPVGEESVLPAKSATDAAREAVEVSFVDHQAWGQIDDLAHGPDEQPLLREPAAEEIPVYRSVELYDTDGAEHAYVDHAG